MERPHNERDSLATIGVVVTLLLLVGEFLFIIFGDARQTPLFLILLFTLIGAVVLIGTLLE